MWKVAMREVLGELDYPVNSNSELLKKLQDSFGESAHVIGTKSNQLADLNITQTNLWPILVVANEPTQSLAYLKLFARTYLSGYKAFSVICNKKPEWEAFIRPETHDFLSGFYEDAAQEQLVTISANSRNKVGWSTLLVLEDLKNVTTVDFDARQILRGFQTKGTSQGVFTIAGAAFKDLSQMPPWPDHFRTIIAVE